MRISTITPDCTTTKVRLHPHEWCYTYMHTIVLTTVVEPLYSVWGQRGIVIDESCDIIRSCDISLPQFPLRQGTRTEITSDDRKT